MTILTLYRRSCFIVLLGLATTAHSGSYFKNIQDNLYFQYASGTFSNLCKIGSMCGSGLAWLGQKGLAGTYYTTELIKNNPKIAGTIALYTAWYMGQKRWAEDTINKAEKFLASANRSGVNPTFKTWEKNRYSTIASIMSDRLAVGENLIKGYNDFNTLSFCKCLKDKVSQNPDTKALAIKLALEIEYLKTEEILNLFTKNRTIGLTNTPYWIEEWIQNNYGIKDADIFDLYNLLITDDRKSNQLISQQDQTNKRLIKEEKEKIATAQKHIQKIKQEAPTQLTDILHSAKLIVESSAQKLKEKGKEAEKSEEIDMKEIENKHNEETKRRIKQYKQIITTAQERMHQLQENEPKRIIKLNERLAAQYEQNLNQFIAQKIASTGLPVTRFSSQQPAAYWSWMQAARWNIPSGFIWPYEQQASQLYWELFKYTQRIAALHSAISEYIKENELPDVGSSYSLGQSQQIINAVNQFLGNSEACNAQYCIKKLEGLQ